MFNSAEHIDQKTGFHSTQLLCVPAQSPNGAVFGAIQIINSSHGTPFSEMDIELLQAFRVYAQLAIINHLQPKSEA